MKSIVRWSVALVFAILATAVVLYWFHHRAAASFLVSIVSSFGVIVAITVALFGDKFKHWIEPIEVEIEEQRVRNEDRDTHPQYGKVILHHLRAKNKTPHRPVKNCRIWLEHVEEKMPDGSFIQRTPFAVPRLLTWAPMEFLPESGEKSFADEMIFDFGLTIIESGKFLPQWNTKQGGYVTPDTLACPPNACRRYFLKIAADNYFPRDHHVIEVEASPSEDGNVTTTITIKK